MMEVAELFLHFFFLIFFISKFLTNSAHLVVHDIFSISQGHCDSVSGTLSESFDLPILTGIAMAINQE